MIPKLYHGTESLFVSEGIGRLTELTECTVTEEINGGYELTAVYPVEGLHYNDLALGQYIYCIPYRGADPQAFSIYAISKPMDGLVTINAEHISYRLSHIPVMPFRAGSLSAALGYMSSNAAEACPFSFETDISSSESIQVEVPTSGKAIIYDGDKSLLATYGGEVECDMFTVRLLDHRGQSTTRVIRYGKDLIDINQEASIADTLTGVCPYYYKDDRLVTLPERVLHSSAAGNYPYQRTVALDCSSAFESKPSVSQLRDYAADYMTSNNIGVPTVSLTVSFADLAATEEYAGLAPTEEVHIGDTIRVEFEKLGVSNSARIVSYEFDVLRERYNQVTIGSPRESLAKTIIDTEKTDQSATIGTAVAEANRFRQAGSETVTLSNSDEAALLSMTALDDMFGLDPGTCNNTNTVVTAVNADTSITTNVRGVGYSSGSWVVKFDSLVTGSVLVAYTAVYYGG